LWGDVDNCWPAPRPYGDDLAVHMGESAIPSLCGRGAS
jgi:hypothetical protein